MKEMLLFGFECFDTCHKSPESFTRWGGGGGTAVFCFLSGFVEFSVRLSKERHYISTVTVILLCKQSYIGGRLGGGGGGAHINGCFYN